MKGRVAILGATGFIGKAVTSLFLNEEIDMEACSKNGGTLNSFPVDQVDISKEGALSQWLKNKDVDAIIYLSSKIPSSFLEADWDLFYYNLMMHKQVLDYWKTNGCHLIYASSCSVYGSRGPIPWKENNTTIPDNYYSISKLVGEILFYQEYQKGLPLTILRINAPYGVDTRRKTVINIFLESALKGKTLILFGSGNRQQDFIYVLDVARAFWISYLRKKYGIYNIASGKTVTMKELANIIINQTNSSSKIIYSGEPDPQEGFQVNIDISKARNELGFLPEYSLEDGFKECILHYREAGL
jgi:UDP-glucose 4-epimerase